jgi:D-3-phosphoglycerate dehydrogenase
MTSNVKTSFPKNKIKVLLLENIHQNAIDLFKKETFTVESITGTPTTEELKEKIRDVHILGIRSTTMLTKEILEEAKRIICIGCFCIGTNQVDLESAEKLGVNIILLLHIINNSDSSI